MNAKNNGVTAEEMAEVITHAAVYNTLLTMSKAAAVSALPSSVDLTNEFPKPGNQGTQGSCTCWAVGYAVKSHQEYVEHGWDFTDKTTYSPTYIYT